MLERRGGERGREEGEKKRRRGRKKKGEWFAGVKGSVECGGVVARLNGWGRAGENGGGVLLLAATCLALHHDN